MCEPAAFQWRTTQHCLNNIMRVSFCVCSCTFQAAYYNFLWVFVTLDWIITGCSLTLSKTGKENNHHYLYVSLLKTVSPQPRWHQHPWTGMLKMQSCAWGNEQVWSQFARQLFVKIEAKKIKEGSERSNPKRTAGLCTRRKLFLQFTSLKHVLIFKCTLNVHF